MAFERNLAAVPPQAFTANGTSLGVVTIASTCGFYIKQAVVLQSSSQGELGFQIKNILSDTQLVVGPSNNKINSVPNYSDISAFLVADGASIWAPEQGKSPIPEKDHYLDVYEPAPLSADRIIPVDCHGNFYDSANPLPVAIDGTITIGDVSIVEGGNTVTVNDNGSINVTLEPGTVQIGSVEVIGPGPTNYPLTVNADGSINVVVENAPSANTTVVNTYNEVVSLAAGATILIVTYTVPMGKESVFQRASFSGENIARYDLIINGVTQDTARTNFGGDLTGEFNFETGNDSGLVLASGDTISVQVYNVRPTSADFEARIQVLEIPA
jgi:hypothetical protein